MNDHQCPACKSDDVSGGPFECDDGIVWQDVTCGNCSTEWQNVYQFMYCDNIETQSPNTEEVSQ